MARQMFTCNATFEFYAEDFESAQKWVLDTLKKDAGDNKLVVNRCDLVGWVDPQTRQPVLEKADE